MEMSPRVRFRRHILGTQLLTVDGPTATPRNRDIESGRERIPCGEQ